MFTDDWVRQQRGALLTALTNEPSSWASAIPRDLPNYLIGPMVADDTAEQENFIYRYPAALEYSATELANGCLLFNTVTVPVTHEYLADLAAGSCVTRLSYAPGSAQLFYSVHTDPWAEMKWGQRPEDYTLRLLFETVVPLRNIYAPADAPAIKLVTFCLDDLGSVFVLDTEDNLWVGVQTPQDGQFYGLILLIAGAVLRAQVGFSTKGVFTNMWGSVRKLSVYGGVAYLGYSVHGHDDLCAVDLTPAFTRPNGEAQLDEFPVGSMLGAVSALAPGVLLLQKPDRPTLKFLVADALHRFHFSLGIGTIVAQREGHQFSLLTTNINRVILDCGIVSGDLVYVLPARAAERE